MKSQLFLTKHEYLSLNRAVVQTQRWAQSEPISSGVGPGFVLEESILRSLSCMPQCSGSQSACSYPAAAGEFVLLGHWETLAKEGKFSFQSQAQKHGLVTHRPHKSLRNILEHHYLLPSV